MSRSRRHFVRMGACLQISSARNWRELKPEQMGTHCNLVLNGLNTALSHANSHHKPPKRTYAHVSRLQVENPGENPLARTSKRLSENPGEFSTRVSKINFEKREKTSQVKTKPKFQTQ